MNDEARLFLRGLIHSDGSRFTTVECKGASVRRVVRYGFKNFSEDILEIFGAACTTTGVQFTRPSATQIAIYRKDSVARLDEFVGPKY